MRLSVIEWRLLLFRQVKPSIKVVCPTKLSIVKRISDSVFLKCFWKHENRDLNPISDIVDLRISEEYAEEHMD
ncbi:hypothetical protein MFLAVUS_007592 [Mucor flavus]|uniref:Uncharacterized protein n=1 Tax=Mucor flavus TaxID=439312 RepID=A0ABP9Z4R0_9FUNG